VVKGEVSGYCECVYCGWRVYYLSDCGGVF